jgi:Flp pilus assembly pilin Flp
MRRAILLRRMLEDNTGATLVEFTIIVGLFLGLTFALIDFGRAFFQWVMAEKATQIAARIAAVRAPACPGVPSINLKRSPNDASIRYGLSCADATLPCVDGGSITCAGDPASPLAATIMARTGALLPAGITATNLRFRYDYAGLGFLGGPYIPMVTVELRDVSFEFLALGPFVTFLGGGGFENEISMPPMRATLPAEDLG